MTFVKLTALWLYLCSTAFGRKKFTWWYTTTYLSFSSSLSKEAPRSAALGSLLLIQRVGLMFRVVARMIQFLKGISSVLYIHTYTQSCTLARTYTDSIWNMLYILYVRLFLNKNNKLESNWCKYVSILEKLYVACCLFWWCFLRPCVWLLSTFKAVCCPFGS